MIRVWYSNQLELLANRLIENLLQGGGRSPSRLFAMPPIVVPNRSIEAFLKYEIARGAGIAAGLAFYVPESFLDTLLPEKTAGAPAVRLLHTAALRAFFLDVFCQEDRAGATRLPPEVCAYVEAARDDRDGRDLRCFQLAARLARLGHQYGESRPDLLRDWAQGRATLSGGPLAATEAWQRELWSRVLRARDQAERERGIEWVLPFDLLRHSGQPGCQGPDEIHFFGFSYLSFSLWELMRELGRRAALDIYTFSPCNWCEDVLRDPATAEASRCRLGTNAVSEPDYLSITTRWGRPGRECAGWLSELAGPEFHRELAPPEAATVLGRLQREILEQAPQSAEPFEPDDSLVILGCPAIRREAEIVANEIWRLVQADDRGPDGRSPARLRFRDIAVLFADSVNRAAYQAHFRAVFEELYGIPHNMVDLPLAGECQVIEAVHLLLALPLGEFTRPELLKILGHPAVRARFPEADADRWRSWCLELEVVRGADRADHAGTYIDRDVFHWEQGLRRLVLGAFMTGPRSEDDRAFCLDCSDYSPHELPADALADAARLLLLARSLVADARFARQAELTMTDWSEFFLRMVSAYLGANTDSEQRALAACRRKIHDLRKLDVSGCSVGYRIACESLREALDGLTGERGYYLADGVVVSPLKEMRALPFRVIFLCGLGEGRFPAAEGLDPLDLRVERSTGDVTPRERDKYLFLETLACARERLYLSYVARDAQTHDPLSPSPVLNELLRYLHGRRAGEPALCWVETHKLRRYHEYYFGGQPGTPPKTRAASNHSRAALLEYRARELHKTLSDDVGGKRPLERAVLRQLDQGLMDWLGLCRLDGARARAEPARKLAVSLSDLRRFLECPLQGWARLMLRLREDDEEDEAAREDEPFATGRMRETGLLREVFLDAIRRGVTAGDSAAYEALYKPRAESWTRRGLMPVGLFGESEERRHLACLTGWHAWFSTQTLLQEGPLLAYRFGRAGEHERVDRLERAIPLDVSLPGGAAGGRAVRVELYGRTEIVSSSLPGSLTPVVRSSHKEKDFLRGFLDAVVLSLLPGHHDPSAYHAHVVPWSSKEKPASSSRTFRGIDEPTARRFLADLLTDLLGGPHAYLLPCEAVFEFLNPKRRTPIEESVERMKDDERSDCSSRYGPVPNFELYDPPGEDEARAIIERRFGLYRDSGGMG